MMDEDRDTISVTFRTADGEITFGPDRISIWYDVKRYTHVIQATVTDQQLAESGGESWNMMQELVKIFNEGKQDLQKKKKREKELTCQNLLTD